MPDDERNPDPQPSEVKPPAEDEEPSAPAESAQDRFRPEAIAARVDALGEETDLDRIARQEEQKLLARKKGRGKRGLEAAASKRLAKIGETAVKRPAFASDVYIPEADPLMERARRVRAWIKGNSGLFAGLVAVAVVAVGGALGWSYLQTKREADASTALAQAFAAEHGHVSSKDEDDDDDSRAAQLYPTFHSAADRRAAALAKYRDVESRYAGTGAALLSRLAEAGLLLDQEDGKGALSVYEDVKGSPLAQVDAEVRGRAFEGIGFAQELLASSDAPNRDKHLDDALAAYKSLEQVDLRGMKELGSYHQARVLQAKGDKAKAIELLKDVYKRVTEPGETHPFSYLEFIVEDRLRTLDPTALPPKAAAHGGPPGPGGGNVDTSNPQVQEILRKLQQQAQQKGAPPLPPAPGGSP